MAGARRAAGRESEQLAASTVGELLHSLRVRENVRLNEVLEACSVLVDGAAATVDTALTPGTVVDLLPPFAGG